VKKSQLKKIARRKKVTKTIRLKQQGIGVGCHGLRGEAIKEAQREEQTLKAQLLRRTGPVAHGKK